MDVCRVVVPKNPRGGVGGYPLCASYASWRMGGDRRREGLLAVSGRRCSTLALQRTVRG